MRNLKKILALALALVMSMSLMATANAFTDDDSINDTYETAVTVLSGLKVFQGYDDGSFLPQGAITRAEVAAIIYRIVTGDVADTQVGIYADYNKFDDVASTSWYAGYVNFCANAEYIKGYDARTFGPNDPVTGYQALAMILRALGYDKNGEFTGTNWQVQTAAVGESRGITKNITAGTLGVPATREVVAEILFQAILVNTVTYMPAFGYREDETSLGWETFGLEYVTGVVTANEYADLYDTNPLDEGETRLDVNGEDYDIAYSTTLEEMGMAYNVYLANGGRVLAIADAGNTVFETGEGTEIDEDNTGMDVDDAARFLNFGEDASVYTSDWRIEYEVSFVVEKDAAGHTGDTELRAALENLKDEGFNISVFPTDADEYDWRDIDDETEMYTISFSFRPDANISSAHMNNIEEIFAIADKEDADNADEYVTGEVYVGTRSTEDVSDEMSFRQFKSEYINDENKDADFDESDNGEWLKVIDNDGDGVADYVFLTEFVMSYIERISTSGTYYLADLSAREDAAHFNDVEIDSDDVITEDEFSRGDVVIYTLIDGNYYMDLAEVVTETVDEKGIDKKTETMTCDGTDYVQSHIGYTTETYYNDVTEAHTEETYDLYLDHFGYVRLFIESDYSTFMLLTDGYYKDDRRAEDFQAYYWDVDAEEESLIDVVDNDDNFIWTEKEYQGTVDVWGNLKGADETYGFKAADGRIHDVYATNIAGYSETDGGYDLKNVEDSAERMDYTVQAIDADTDLDERELTGSVWSWRADDWVDTRVQTGTNTQYYLVIRSDDDETANGWSVDDVITWTGYKNAPAEAELGANAVAYAVTRPTDTTNGRYFVADVVVFECYAADDYDTYFVYERNNWHVEYVYAIGYDEEGVISTENKVDVENDPVIREIEFYLIDDNGDVRDIDVINESGNYEAANIYAGEANTSWDMEPENYIQVRGTAADGNLYIEDAPIYYIVLEADGDYNVRPLDRDKVNNNDEMILFTDDEEHVEYAIDVTMSYVETAAGNDYSSSEAWDDLYAKIVRDTIVTPYPTAAPTAVVYDADGNSVKTGVANETYNTVTIDLTYEEYEKVLEDSGMVNVELSAAEGNEINISGSSAWTNGSETLPLTVNFANGNGFASAMVSSQGTANGAVGAVEQYTVIVNVKAAQTGETLETKADVDGITVDGTEIQVLNGTELDVAVLESLLDEDSDLATVSDITWDDATHNTGKVTVTSEANVAANKAGTEYTIVFGTNVTINGDDKGFYPNETNVSLENSEEYRVIADGKEINGAKNPWTGMNYQITGNAAELIFDQKFTYTIPAEDSVADGGYNYACRLTVNNVVGNTAQDVTGTAFYGDKLTIVYNYTETSPGAPDFGGGFQIRYSDGTNSSVLYQTSDASTKDQVNAVLAEKNVTITSDITFYIDEIA